MKNKNVLVTGCDGFVATALIKKLLKLDFKVVGIYKNGSKNHNFIIKHKNFNRFKIDINNKQNLLNLFRNNNFSCVFHLAAVSQVLTSNKYPYQNFKTNIFGTINILECVRTNCPDAFVIFSSSDKAYGDSNKLPYKENFPLNGLNPDDASKASADIIVRSYNKSLGLNTVVTRFVNIYGPGDTNWKRLIPGTIKSIFNNEKIIIRSNGGFLRDYLYIDDVINGYIKIFNLQKKSLSKVCGKAINFGCNKPKTVMEIVNQIISLTKYNVKDNLKILNESKLEIKDQYSSNQLSKKLLDWKPKVTLEQGLKKTIDWYINSYTL